VAAALRASLTRMVKDSEKHEETPIARLDEMRARYDGCDLDGGPAGLAIQVRDRIIRGLIDELKWERARREADR
jgi:hypothetical protein